LEDFEDASTDEFFYEAISDIIHMYIYWYIRGTGYVVYIVR
jgi:hypothetical protein